MTPGVLLSLIAPAEVKFTVLPEIVPRLRLPEVVVVNEASPLALTFSAVRSAPSLLMLIFPVPVVAD